MLGNHFLSSLKNIVVICSSKTLVGGYNQTCIGSVQRYAEVLWIKIPAVHLVRSAENTLYFRLRSRKRLSFALLIFAEAIRYMALVIF